VGFHAGNAGPATLGQFHVKGGECLLVCRDVFFGVDRVDRTLGDADGAINALVRVDDQKIGTFAKTVNRADIDAICVFALDTGFCDYVCHD
jgi:hypothetical protein